MTETKRHSPLAQPAVHACLQHPQDAPDQLLAVAAARLVPADLLIALPQLACGHRPEPYITAKRGSSESGEVAGQNARWEARNAMFCAASGK